MKKKEKSAGAGKQIGGAPDFMNSSTLPPLLAAAGVDLQAAEALAARLGVCLLPPGAEPRGLYLLLDAGGLALADGPQLLRGDFSRLLPRLRPHNLNGELLIRAARCKEVCGTPTAVDATAGLGEDAFLLAAAGYSVRLYERDPVIAALLADALARAAEQPELAPVVARMQLIVADSTLALPRLPAPPDVILLDPMFPARQKSGLIKKKFQLLQQLESPCEQEAQLLQAALAASPRKILVKRPLKGPFLAGCRPSYSLKGKAIRYDCILPPPKGL